mgnify:CR=1 FL=1|jgi:sRNA-binding regulator protein Hfq
MIRIIRFFQDLFQLKIKVKSFEEFVNVLKREACDEVTASAVVYKPQGEQSATVGSIGTFKYFVVLTSKTPGGRSVTYQHLVIEQFGSTRGLSDWNDNSKATVRTLVEADKMLRKIRKNIPEVGTTLLKPDGTPFSEELIKRLYKDAEKIGVI